MLTFPPQVTIDATFYGYKPSGVLIPRGKTARKGDSLGNDDLNFPEAFRVRNCTKVVNKDGA